MTESDSKLKGFKLVDGKINTGNSELILNTRGRFVKGAWRDFQPLYDSYVVMGPINEDKNTFILDNCVISKVTDVDFSGLK